MTVLVVGCGSIGRRHLENLKALGENDLVAFDLAEERMARAEADFGVQTVASLEQGLALAPRAALVCSPTAVHLTQARQGMAAGAHLFIEKPISHEREGVREFVREADARGVRVLVGCNFRFDRGLRLMKEALEEGAVGRPVTASAIFGQYLPDWHPWEDYRKGYSARKELGGGILLDAVHEIDALRWLLGEVDAVSCFAGSVGTLEMDVEDHADLLLHFTAGITGQVHVDYLRRAYHRGVEVHGTEGSLVWTFQDRELRQYDADLKKWSVIEWREDAEYSVNQMYVDEMSHFLRVVAGEEASVQNGHEALRVLDIVLAARASAESGRVQRLPERCQ